VGSQWISEETDPDEIRSKVMSALRNKFRPEFLNRIDETIIFHALTEEHLVKIVDIQLERIKAFVADRNIELQVSPAAREALAEEGFDPVYGARPLKRTIQRRIQDPLAMEILESRFKEGDTVRVDFKDGEYVFEIAKERVPAGVQN
jgi:ATP-dependent Clp protease ATP-binding subunit ClpB